MRMLSVAGLAASLLSPLPALAQPGPAAPIAALNHGLEQAEKMGGQPFPVRYQALAPAVDQAFDLPHILKTIVGLRWPSIPAAQQTQLLASFRAFTIANYVSNFNADSGDTFRILPDTRTVGADQIVETEIVPKSGDPVRMDYVMRQAGGGWKAIDVLEQGTISQAAVQRSDFRSLLETGDASNLIAKLDQKVSNFSGGTVKP